MNLDVEQIIKLKESGFTIEEIKEIGGFNAQSKVNKDVLNDNADITKIEKDIEKPKDKEEKVELNDNIKEMMNNFKTEMDEKIKSFKEAIQLSNMNQNLGNQEELNSKQIAEYFTANVINPSYKGGIKE